tara:strand:- start:4957 stop:5607 length:651 start_codon:yes stop_codon:yes gene_type:complete
MGAVLAAGLGMGAIGAAGGILGAIGGQQDAQAQYLANKIEVERNNFENSLKNDKQNMALARKNAQIRFNNAKIGEAAVKNYSDTLRDNKTMFAAASKQSAKNLISSFATMEARATGKNLRGGMQARFKALATEKGKEQRSALVLEKFRMDTSAENVYQNALSQRDLMTRGEANIYMPGSTGIAPGSGTLNLIAGLLGGGASGFASGVSTGATLKEL